MPSNEEFADGGDSAGTPRIEGFGNQKLLAFGGAVTLLLIVCIAALNGDLRATIVFGTGTLFITALLYYYRDEWRNP